jgi:hypothetical protein
MSFLRRCWTGIVVLVLALPFFLVLSAAWLAVLVAVTGGVPVECDAGDCGALGEFTSSSWPLVPLALFAASTFLATLAGRRIRRRSGG